MQVETENNIYIYDDLAKNKLICNGEPIIINDISPLDSSFLSFIRSLTPVLQAPNLCTSADISIRTVKILEEAEKLINI